MMQKIGSVLTSIRVWTINLLTLGFLIYLVVVIGALMSQMPEAVEPDGKVLIIAPEGTLRDQAVYPSELSIPFGLMGAESQLQSAVSFLSKALSNSQVKARARLVGTLEAPQRADAPFTGATPRPARSRAVGGGDVE